MSGVTRKLTSCFVLLATLLAAACDRPTAPGAESASISPASEPTIERVLRRGNGGDPGSLDPQLSVDHYAHQIQRDLYEGLVSEAADGTLVPGVAIQWSVSPDGLVYRFDLRPDARWSDGSPVVADHFVAALRHAAAPSTGAPSADLLRSIANAPQVLAGELPPPSLGVRAISPLELEIRLESPTAYFLSQVTHPVFYPRHPGASGASPALTYAVSNGAFRFKDWVPNSQVELVRNPHYWDHSGVQLDRVLFYPIASEATEYLRYRAGDLDLTSSLPTSRIAEVRRERPSELHMAPFLGTYYLGLNLSRPPFAGNADLSRALSLAIDRELLNDLVLFGAQRPAWGLVPPGTPLYSPQRDPAAAQTQPERLALAKALFVRATVGREQPVKLRVIYGNSDLVRSTLIAIASMWKEAFGLEVEVYSEEFRVYLETQKNPDAWQILRMAWVADYNDPLTFLETFHSGNAGNIYGYRNRRFDALLDSSQRTVDTRARLALLEQAERTLLDDAAFIPLFHMQSRRLVSPRVVGLEPTPLNRIYSRHLRLRD